MSNANQTKWFEILFNNERCIVNEVKEKGLRYESKLRDGLSGKLLAELVITASGATYKFYEE